jgi:hypothetical protein
MRVTQRVVRETDGGVGHLCLCKWTRINDWKASEQGEHSRIHTEVVQEAMRVLDGTRFATDNQCNDQLRGWGS